MATAINFVQNSSEALQGVQALSEGDTRTFACTYWAAPSTPTAVAYRSTSGTGNGRAVTSTVFPTNSPSASGNVVTLSLATGFVGNADYLLSISATVDSQVYVRYIRVRVRKDESMG
jgi:hypothetical protein